MAKKAARAFTIKRATREAMKVYLGVAGPSSSGKTYTALRLGTGIQSVVGGELGLIDTENDRALMYADDFKFQHIPFHPPFNALSYFDALKFAASKGVKTLIVDSMSHEHEGEGGHLAMHEAELDRMSKGDASKRDRYNFMAWGRPAAERRELLLALQRSPMNLILCFRAKDKLVLIKNRDGKQEPVSIGWQPIAGPEYVFDMTALVVLPPRSGGVPDWKAEAAKVAKGWGSLFIQDKPLDEATGERLARYATGEKVKPVGQEIAPLKADARRQTGGDAGGGDVPDWAPAEGWPEFKTVSEWAKWSTTFLAKAERDHANAWAQWWSGYTLKLADMVRENRRDADKIEKELKAALAGAMKREGKLI